MNIIGALLNSVVFILQPLNLSSNNSGSFISHLSNFIPSPEFLSDVAAFEAVVIALAVPLSFEIISRISERYQSEVISKQFTREWEIKWLPKFLILNIILAVTLRFLVKDNPSSGLWVIIAGIIFGSFLFIAIILLIFIEKLRMYMTEPEKVLNTLYQDADELFK